MSAIFEVGEMTRAIEVLQRRLVAAGRGTVGGWGRCTPPYYIDCDKIRSMP